MHIAYLTPEYPHELCTASGGLGTSIRNMAEALVKKGKKVSVLVYSQNSEQHFSDKGIHFYLIEQRKYPFGGWYFYRKYLEKRINRIIFKEGINIFETPDWTGITAFMKFEIPHIIRLHGTDGYFCELENRRQKYKNRLFERSALINADSIVSVSDFTGKKTMEVFDLERKYKVIHNSIRIEDFQASKIKPVPGRILYFGSLIRKKGVLELAEIYNRVVRENPEVKLILAGRDIVDIFENTSTLELFKNKLTQKAIKQFEYIGSLDYSKVREELENASLVVLPSFAEAMPMTWLESMAMGKALVTSNIGWAPEVMIDGKTGYMVDPRNHKLYASRIVDLLKDSKLSKGMGKAARELVVRNFSSKVVAEQNIKFYQELIEKKNLDLN
ncbi:glycosyltransferase family 4 protein [Christiangramia echinicola]|uniref:glycosyltransferase family 4 protein n=1 Tax=Christiangramia echinicola TaxID=279359 RepID=UPI000417F5C4|nr:glycosyltransferase family 4 protein [Christiangramia echinicola]